MEFRHTIQCSKCKETKKTFKEFDTADKNTTNGSKSECCNASFEYVGLQPYSQNILNVPFIIKKAPAEVQEESSMIIEETPIVEEKIEQPQLQPEPVKTSNLNIEDIIVVGPKGVSNAQMIPALKAAITEGSKGKLTLLKETYPEVFEASKRYIPGKMLKQLEIILSED